MKYHYLLFALILFLPSWSLGEEFVDRPTLLLPRVPRNAADQERLQAEAMVLEARVLERRGQKPVALRKYQRAWRLDQSTTVLKQIVPLALQLGRVEEATRYALLLADSDLDDPFLAERMAMLMSDQLQFDRSLQLYQQVLKLRSQDEGSRNPLAMRFEMGRLYFLTEKYEQAAQSFRVVLEAIESESSDLLPDGFRKAFLKDAKSIYTLMAESFLEVGDYEAAETTFQKANEAQPNQEWLTFQLARVDFRAKRFEAAREKLQSYVRQKLRFGGETPYELLQAMMDQASQDLGGNPSSDTAHRNANQEPDSKSTFVLFRDWLADDPDNFPLLSYVAELTRRQGVLQDAAALYEKSIECNPNREGYQKLLRIYREMGDSDKLLELLGKIVGKQNDLEGFDAEVQSLVTDQEFFGELLQLGQQRLNGQPANARQIAVACGLLALQAKDYAAAEEFLGQAGDAPRHVDLYINWGLRLLVDEQYAQAAKIFEAGLKGDRDANTGAMLRYYLSGALQLDGRTDEALEVANQVAESAKQIPEFALRPAWILYNAGRIRPANEGYVAWLEEHAEDYSMPGLRDVVRDARFVVSSICVDLGHADEAIEWLEKVLDEFPQDVAAHNDLGYLLVDNNRSLQRALKMIRFAVSKEPDNPMYRDSLGWAFFRLKKFDEAIRELQKASSEEPPDPIILDHLAESQLATGDSESAGQTWNRALNLIEPGTNNELRDKIEEKLQVAETQNGRPFEVGKYPAPQGAARRTAGKTLEQAQ